jgi:hypothetical protein
MLINYDKKYDKEGVIIMTKKISTNKKKRSGGMDHA